MGRALLACMWTFAAAFALLTCVNLGRAWTVEAGSGYISLK